MKKTRKEMACDVYDTFVRYEGLFKKGAVEHEFVWKGKAYFSTNLDSIAVLLALWVIDPNFDELDSKTIRKGREPEELA